MWMSGSLDGSHACTHRPGLRYHLRYSASVRVASRTSKYGLLYFRACNGSPVGRSFAAFGGSCAPCLRQTKFGSWKMY